MIATLLLANRSQIGLVFRTKLFLVVINVEEKNFQISTKVPFFRGRPKSDSKVFFCPPIVKIYFQKILKGDEI